MIFDLTKVYYPTYIVAVPNTPRLIYIPTSGSLGLKDIKGAELNPLKFHKLKTITDTVLECYELDGKLCFFDAIPIQDFKSGSKDLLYFDRRKLLNSILVERLANFNLYSELHNVMAYSPAELKRFYAYCLTLGYKGSMIISRYSPYMWGKVNDDDNHVMEMTPNGQ